MSGQIKKTGRKAEQAGRLAALMEAAESVFLQKGYYAATMSDVAKAAGMSKKTIYEMVESKIELFSSILAAHHDKLVFPAPEPGWSVTDTLTANLLALGRFMLDPAQIALLRLILAEYTHSPELGRLFMRSRMVKAKTRLEDALCGVALSNGVPEATAKEAAAMLIGMALGEFHIGTLIGFRAPPSRAALEARIRNAVRIFVAGVRAEGLSLPSKTCVGRPPGGRS